MVIVFGKHSKWEQWSDVTNMYIYGNVYVDDNKENGNQSLYSYNVDLRLATFFYHDNQQFIPA